MTDIKNEEAGEKKSLNFIEQAVENDLKAGKNGGKVQTRFPPNQTVTCTSGTLKPFVSTSASLPHTAVCATFVSTTLTRRKRIWNM